MEFFWKYIVGTTHVGHMSLTFTLFFKTYSPDSLFETQNSDPENHTLFSRTYPPRIYEGVPPPPRAFCLQQTKRVTEVVYNCFNGMLISHWTLDPHGQFRAD